MAATIANMTLASVNRHVMHFLLTNLRRMQRRRIDGKSAIGTL
jgi:hypothetical protein